MKICEKKLGLGLNSWLTFKAWDWPGINFLELDPSLTKNHYWWNKVYKKSWESFSAGISTAGIHLGIVNSIVNSCKKKKHTIYNLIVYIFTDILDLSLRRGRTWGQTILLLWRPGILPWPLLERFTRITRVPANSLCPPKEGSSICSKRGFWLWVWLP